MAAFRGPRLQAGSAAWIAEERSAAFQIVQQEVEEFSYSARNELDWLNEHMAGIFDENAVNFAEAFKTPGRLRGKTPRTVGKSRLAAGRVPLSDVFAATPNGSKRRTPHHVNAKLSPRHQSRVSKASPASLRHTSPRRRVPSPKPAIQPSTQDSGYYGSQDIGPVQVDNFAGSEDTQDVDFDQVAPQAPPAPSTRTSTSRALASSLPEEHAGVASGERITANLQDSAPINQIIANNSAAHSRDREDNVQEQAAQPDDNSSPIPGLGLDEEIVQRGDSNRKNQFDGNESPSEDIRSPSDGSSPIRQVVRKSSLNFASLPAREPLASKSIGPRVSRTSHLDHHRASYHSKPTEGKSLAETNFDDPDGDDLELIDAGADENSKPSPKTEDVTLHHAKTYTQRLQDQISKLGETQPANSRLSKSIPSFPQTTAAAALPATPSAERSSPARKEVTTTTPGAFPEEEDEDENDDWIDPPPEVVEVKEARPPFPKSHSADVMEKIHGKTTVGEGLTVADHRVTRSQEPIDSESLYLTQASGAPLHRKSASTSAGLAKTRTDNLPGLPLTKAVTVSNPTMAAYSEISRSNMSPKSPSRSFRTSPLKQVKDKMSSILKISKGLLASSATTSADAKLAILSPSPRQIGYFAGASSETVAAKLSFESPRPRSTMQMAEQPASPTRPVARRTRASIEREREEKRREKEAKVIAEQYEKLQEAREKERERARVFSKDQDKTIQSELQGTSRKGDETSSVKETPRATRTSPRRAKPAGDGASASADREVEMHDMPSSMPPPSVPRSAGISQVSRAKETKRPVKPSKDAYAKPKQAPTVIRVNTGSQHSQLNPSTSSLAANVGATPSQPSQQLTSKASKPSLQAKTPAQNLKSSVSSNGRPRVLELAAKKKEQDEREAQRRTKAELERKRAEEQRRQEQQRKQEAESQKQREAEQVEARKLAQRQVIEKAKQTRAPPPAVRSQLPSSNDASASSERPASSFAGQRIDAQIPRPPSRMTSNIHRPHESTRPVNAVLSNAAKSATKRPLGADGEHGLVKRAPSRGPAYQTADAKRRRTSAEFEDELEMSYAPSIKGPPVRPSVGLKKEIMTKSTFANGYSNVPQSATQDLFKATVTSNHMNMNHAKAAHPLDMAQISKGSIPFAPNSNAAGPAYKTPARPGASSALKSAVKPAQRSSPRFQNGENIELPEIQTDDEDDDDDEPQHMGVASWTDSPALREALANQERMDPFAVFGPPRPLNMEEVFNKSKDKFHKFRMRTSSANWSGTDRLTEDDIRKDMAARDKLRREGGWTYEMGKSLL
ncbi:Inner centromere protein-related protein pic1 [Paramyrothecium foliicola]|nr:Inner centromere protein-related protein pic1 [Paramyrothecium foliicola]